MNFNTFYNKILTEENMMKPFGTVQVRIHFGFTMII